MAGPKLTKPTKLHELRVAGQALLHARQRRRAQAPEPDREALERLARAVAALPDGVVLEHRIVDVPADRPPWLETGIELAAGDQVSTFAVGRVHLSRALDIWLGPAFQLWGRVGPSGPVFRGTRPTNTFRAEQDGRLELASYFPGEWADRAGTLGTPPEDYAKVPGAMSALVVRWAPGTDPRDGLRALAGSDDADGLGAAELARLDDAVATPAGWRYLWYLGDSEIFRAAPGAKPEADPATPPHIACATHADTGILQRDVDVPLTDATRLQWSWRVDELPSILPEDTLASHDYLSIALEFDNGQDLTWQWSASLPVEHAYRCPIPTWKDKETHIVVRSGSAELGRWLQEDRPVRRDYAAAVGPPPERIVRVWLIAVSLFQRRSGRCAFADIQLTNDGP